MKTKIVLNLIMKNEEKVLHRLLESVYHLIDHYVVVDTGSTDKSIEIVENFFTSKGITGKIHEYKFTNYEDTRNFAISCIEKDYKGSYGLIIDCDEVIKCDVEFQEKSTEKSHLISQIENSDFITIDCINSSSKYSRGFMFNTSKPFKWVGKVHEYLKCEEENIKHKKIQGFNISSPQDGKTWSEGLQKKYLGHAKILLEEILHSENPSPRDVFYLANSYKDAKEYHEAIKWYSKRLTMLGFFEERYYSQFMIGNMYNVLGHKEEAINEWMKCFELDDLRAEHLINIIVAYQELGMYKTSLVFSKLAYERFHLKNPYPNRVLFLDNPTYEYKIVNAHSINKQKVSQ